jgi:hypothetical protein
MTRAHRESIKSTHPPHVTVRKIAPAPLPFPLGSAAPATLESPRTDRPPVCGRNSPRSTLI